MATLPSSIPIVNTSFPKLKNIYKHLPCKNDTSQGDEERIRKEKCMDNKCIGNRTNNEKKCIGNRTRI
jgi:hypothetical protein